MLVPKRNYSNPVYRYGFQGQEKDNEIKGIGNSVNYKFRMYSPRVGRWLNTDPLKSKYPGVSSYNFAINTPIQAMDPDGRLIIFVNGFMLNHAFASDNRKLIVYHYGTEISEILPNSYIPYPTYEISKEGGKKPIYLGKEFDYWDGIDKMFMGRWKDENIRYVNGSDHSYSEGADRFKAGQQSGYELIAKIIKGDIKLAKDETIKIVGHSHGAAHAAGMASVLQEAYKNGIIKNKVEQIAYLAPQEPTEFNTPQGIFSVQYSRKSDLVASKGIISYKVLSGGSKYGKIKGITEFIQMPDMTGEGNGLNGTRGGHDVGTYRQIFDIPENKPGGVTKNIPDSSREIGPRQEDGTY